MLVGLNLLYLIPNYVGGTQTYAEELLKQLAPLDLNNEYVLFVNQEAATWNPLSAPNVRKVVCPVRGHNRKARYLYEQLILPKLVKKERLDVLHSCGYVGPLHLSCPHIVTIHDLNYIAFGKQMEPIRRSTLAFLVPRVAQRAQKIIAVSEFSRSEILRHLKVEPHKVCVVHEAPRGRRLSASSCAEKIRAELNLKSPYLAAFSSLSPHKNIPVLLEAVARISPLYPYKLVLIGHTPPGSAIEQRINQLSLGHLVVCTGYISDEAAEAILQGATLFVFSSLYEGFGLPALEAQQAGTPLVCSKAGSLPEIAGDGAIYFDPCSVDSLTQAIRTVLDDQALQAELKRKGYANLARFSWHKAAMETLALYRQVA